MTKEEFIIECRKLSIEVTVNELKKLDLYKELLTEWNNKFNLTSITNEKDIYLKHFYDSICLTKAYNLDNRKICDFGTGAGFPGIVLAIFYSNSHFTLLESNNKKVTFLNEVKNKLNLKNVEIINERAEIFGKSNREKFDVVTCRAVSSLNIISELAISMIKVNGVFLSMKSNIEEELKESKRKLNILGYKLKKIVEYNLPIDESKRTILVLEKTKITDLKYPRNYNLIKNNKVIQS